MSVILSDNSVVVTAAQPIGLSQLVSVTSGSDPTYLVLNAFDRNEYTAAASDTTGSFAGNGATLGLNVSDGDAREIGIVFTYNAASGRYYNTTYGYLDQLSFNTSSSFDDVTDLSLFGTSSSSFANRMAANTLGLAEDDPGGYLGTITLATDPSFKGAVPAQATPDSIASIADSFVGQAWNMDGCWVLASTIAAQAGAALPVQSTADMAGQANGEWFVAYNGPAGSTGDWQSMVRAGDVIGFITSDGGGHITTCVSGAGSSAMLVDNITYVDGNGNVVNSAHDGSSNDVTISAPHAASQEWAGVNASSVVIFRLDTPIVTAAGADAVVAGGAAVALSTLFSAADANGRSLTDYQVFTSTGADEIAANGAEITATSAADAATISSLTAADLVRGAAGGSDTVTVRAYNGTYWSDWATIAVSGSAQGATSATTTPTIINPTSTSVATTAPTTTPTQVTADTVSVFRFFDTTDGTHFFTDSPTEVATILATRPDMTYEGVGLQAYASASASASAAAEPVFRFFDTTDGTHFYTASASEEANILATRPDLKLEGTAFYEDATDQPGDVPVYRFFDTAHGTHLYSDSQSEVATILASRPDLTPEGIAFYAPG